MSSCALERHAYAHAGHLLQHCSEPVAHCRPQSGRVGVWWQGRVPNRAPTPAVLRHGHDAGPLQHGPSRKADIPLVTIASHLVTDALRPLEQAGLVTLAACHTRGDHTLSATI
jgi:hypothetical protein